MHGKTLGLTSSVSIGVLEHGVGHVLECRRRVGGAAQVREADGVDDGFPVLELVQVELQLLGVRERLDTDACLRADVERRHDRLGEVQHRVVVLLPDTAGGVNSEHDVCRLWAVWNRRNKLMLACIFLSRSLTSAETYPKWQSNVKHICVRISVKYSVLWHMQEMLSTRFVERVTFQDTGNACAWKHQDRRYEPFWSFHDV